jgi:hypothetical protein
MRLELLRITRLFSACYRNFFMYRRLLLFTRVAVFTPNVDSSPR